MLFTIAVGKRQGPVWPHPLLRSSRWPHATAAGSACNSAAAAWATVNLPMAWHYASTYCASAALKATDTAPVLPKEEAEAEAAMAIV